MERLTEVIKKDFNEKQYPVKHGLGAQYVANQKLGQLEDIEEELGIELTTLFKALKDGVWYKKGTKIIHFVPNDDFRLVLDCNESTETANYWILSIININTNEYIDDFWVNYYGKTWALSKEELEKR